MTSMKKLSLAALLACALAIPAQAAETPSSARHQPLTDDQQRRCETIYKDYIDTVTPLYDRLDSRMMRYDGVRNLSSTSRDDVYSVTDEIDSVRGEIRDAQRNFIAAMEQENLPYCTGLPRYESLDPRYNRGFDPRFKTGIGVEYGYPSSLYGPQPLQYQPQYPYPGLQPHGATAGGNGDR